MEPMHRCEYIDDGRCTYEAVTAYGSVNPVWLCEKHIRPAYHRALDRAVARALEWIEVPNPSPSNRRGRIGRKWWSRGYHDDQYMYACDTFTPSTQPFWEHSDSFGWLMAKAMRECTDIEVHTSGGQTVVTMRRNGTAGNGQNTSWRVALCQALVLTYGGILPEEPQR